MSDRRNGRARSECNYERVIIDIKFHVEMNLSYDIIVVSEAVLV